MGTQPSKEGDTAWLVLVSAKGLREAGIQSFEEGILAGWLVGHGFWGMWVGTHGS